ncbi:MAG: glycoside hydrolase [Clostridium luticellarii]|jgi:hypothetical protein|uniref:BNR/Asp-box repeat protein n=1 Tax=Clostridium luticellarii TaxID=1691940 RepID=A0A2T0BMR9_9CLOT|nr:sialidase family protein [Clostridium luticellarii]MCI1944036.1 glycoside hydrolase [Clostridium luticellarii]MCI1995513.1 glycoside hydrolase [Clostridium luticellarii]MCI2039192.1 glycoside hydrolase [Clostridium luticellarii]PRR85178.1 hypothetical protein CLLU_18220 [Clostridium luticellarii]
MRVKLENILGACRKKAALVVTCSALVLSIGTVTAFAANTAYEKGKMLIKNQNGKTSYSTDNGQSWVNGIPKGAKITVGENGKSVFTAGTPSKSGEYKSLLVKNVNGKKSYSIDGGKTWSQNAPDGYKVTANADGSVSVGKAK